MYVYICMIINLQLKGNAERVAVLEESLARKTKELRSTEERYSRYLQKAKVVSRVESDL